MYAVNVDRMTGRDISYFCSLLFYPLIFHISMLRSPLLFFACYSSYSRPPAEGDESTTFSVSVRDSGAADFLVPERRYDEAVNIDWKPAQRVMMEWREEEDGTGGGGLTPFYGEQHFVVIEVQASPRSLHHLLCFFVFLLFWSVSVSFLFLYKVVRPRWEFSQCLWEIDQWSVCVFRFICSRRQFTSFGVCGRPSHVAKKKRGVLTQSFSTSQIV